MRFSVALVLVCALNSTLSAAERTPAAVRKAINIPAQPLGSALQTLAKDRGFQLVYLSDAVDALKTLGAVGEFTSDEVLQRLLTGTGLTYRYLDEKTVTIFRMSERPAASLKDTPADIGSFRLARSNNFDSRSGEGAQSAGDARNTANDGDEQTASEKSSEDPNSISSAGEEEGEGLTEVVVTGTHIRDAAPVGSPVLVFTQEDIAKSGAATAQQFLAQLPQNFGGGRSEDTNDAIPDGGIDRTYGSAVNLRGLGSGSTLVLVNGRRSAVSGEQEYVDISMIPLSAVERIEVLTDGSSAIYGSDAIGGVVNFILRKRYSGAETRLRLGGTTQGGGQEYQVAQSFGAGWDAGNVLVNFERYQKDKITSLERDFSSGALFPRNLAAGSTKDAIHAHVNQELAGRIRLFGDLSFADRHIDDSSPVDPNPALFTESFYGDVRQYGGSLGVAINLGASWQTELTIGANRSELDGRVASSFFVELGLGEGVFLSKSDIRYFDAKITGDVFSVPAGEIRFALGAGERRSQYESRGGFANLVILETDGSGEHHEARHIFAELLVPVIGGTNTKQSSPPLALSLAGRYEEDSYSHGAKWSSVDPKFGVRWTAMDSVQLRTTYGTSFKAPNVVQTDDSQSAWGWFEFADPQSATGQARVLTLIGNNRFLKPETATTWTIGADITLPWLAGFRAALTYFYIDYTDRISSAPGSTPALVLHDPAFAGVRARRVDIGDAVFNSLASEVLAGGITGCRDADGVPVPRPQPCPMSPESFDAILDFGLQNLAVSQDRGIDLNLTQHLDLGDASVEFALNGTYLFDFLRQYTAEAPSLELVSSPYNPPDARIHASGSWSLRGWTVTGSVHYTDDYRDFSVPGSPGSIGSWTTLDLNMSFDTGRRLTNSWFGNTLIMLNVENFFDRNPPRFEHQLTRLGFDPANADPYGRIVSLTLRKSW